VVGAALLKVEEVETDVWRVATDDSEVVGAALLKVEEVETDVWRVVAVDFEVVGAALLKLETGLRLLYIDNRFAPPHCDN